MKRRKDSLATLIFVLISINFKFLNAEDTHISLNFDSLPQHVILLNETTMDSDFFIYMDENQNYPEQFKLNLVLEMMNAKCGDKRLYVHLEYSDHQQIRGETSWCDDINYGTNFEDILKLESGKTTFTIRTHGNWTGVVAQLVTSIYFETDDCNNCPDNSFCCEGGSSCKGFSKHEDNSITDETWDGHQKLSRCISSLLKCNDHPNCGMTCNADESMEACEPLESDCASSTANCYWQASFFWTAVLAVVFFVMAPTVVVFLVCYHRQMNAMSALRRRGGPVTVSSPANDLPPTYDELAAEEPPPCFCSVTASRPASDNTEGGVDNGSFEPDSNAARKEFECVCGARQRNNTNQVPV